jgi:uncharacterized protein YjiS (DUF1127 family)
MLTLAHASRRTLRPIMTLRPITTLRGILTLHRQRRALLSLDARLLDDIGLTRAQALTEGSRLPWDAPQHWHDTCL